MKAKVKRQKAKVKEDFQSEREIDLRERGISKLRTAGLRDKLKSIAKDWNLPEMNIYDFD
jgi:hypothetical protein